MPTKRNIEEKKEVQPANTHVAKAAARTVKPRTTKAASPSTRKTEVAVQSTVTLPVQEEYPHDEIARLAYSLWEERGAQDGTAIEDWLRAEREVLSRVR